jgi:hypothetical protein
MSGDRVFLGLFALFTAVALYLYGEKSSYKDSISERYEELQTLNREGVLLKDLRENWENKKKRKREISAVKRFSPKPKVRTKGNKLIAEFPEMDRRKLDQLTKKILRSNLIIHRFEIERADEHNAKLKVELAQ